MKHIYTTFIQHLNDAKTPIKHISLWNENVTNLEQESGYELPAVFLELEPISWDQRGGGAKSAQVRIKLHIVTETLADPADSSPYIEQALEHYDIIDQIIAMACDISSTQMNRWQHTATEPDHNHDQIQHHIETFTFQYTKPSQRKQGIAVEAVPEIKV